MSYRYRGPHWARGSPESAEKDPFIQLWVGSLVLVLSMFGYILYEGQFAALANVTFSTAPLYVVLFLVTLFGLWWWKTHETFTNVELSFYFAFAVPATYVATAFGFWYLTDLGDIEIRNGYATEFVWEEGYYTETYDSEKKETVRTTHSPTYTLNTSNSGEYLSLSQSEWNAYVANWGGQGRVSTSRMSLADGESYGSNGNGIPEVHTIGWDRREESKVPTAVEHRYVNYVRASDSVLKIHGAISGYEQFLCDYPRTVNRGLGPVDVDRVITRGATVPAEFVQKVDQLLDRELCHLGAKRQCNIMVYLVGCDRVGFFNALLEKWQLGKKNDIVVVVGCSGSKIGWVRVMAWTDHKLFLEKLEQRVRDLEDIGGKEEAFVRTVVDQVNSPGDGGYLRKPMADFAYLAAGVRLPWWAEVLVILGSCIIVMPTVILIVRD